MKASALGVVQNINAWDRPFHPPVSPEGCLAFGRFYALKSPEKRRGKLRFSPSGRAIFSCFTSDFSPGTHAKNKKINTFQLVMLVAFLQGNSKKN